MDKYSDGFGGIKQVYTVLGFVIVNLAADTGFSASVAYRKC